MAGTVVDEILAAVRTAIEDGIVLDVERTAARIAGDPRDPAWTQCQIAEALVEAGVEARIDMLIAIPRDGARLARPARPAPLRAR
jgi:hypothetical protein